MGLLTPTTLNLVPVACDGRWGEALPAVSLALMWGPYELARSAGTTMYGTSALALSDAQIAAFGAAWLQAAVAGYPKDPVRGSG